MNCPNCQAAVEPGTAFCANCGTPVTPSAPTDETQPLQGGASPGSAIPPGRTSPAAGPGALAFDTSRWSRADRITGVATAVLFISLFLPWFSISYFGITASGSGLDAHGYLYITLILAIVLVGYLVLRAGWADVAARISLPHEGLILAATAVNLLLVLIGFIAKPGGSIVGWDWGAYIALIAAIVAAAPGWVPLIRSRTQRTPQPPATP